jgi:hypothetical protein
MALEGDRGDIILGWLVKLVVVLGLVGLAGFDVLSVATNRISLSDDGTTAAMAASDVYGSSHSSRAAYAAADRSAKDAGATLETRGFQILPDGTVFLTLHRTAHTLIIKRVGPLQRFALGTVAARARAVR